MERSLFPAIAATLLSFAALQATPAFAQRVFVAAQGTDTNPCSFAAPCRSFQHAHDTVAAGGEIDVLDPAGYGSVNITKAISIQGHGFSGVSVTSGGTGIDISAGPGDAVSLNGLLVEGNGVGSNGIRFNSGKSLLVQNCVVRNMASEGLSFGSSIAALQTLTVANSYFTDNNDNGVLIQSSSSGAITAAITRSVFHNNRQGGLSLLGFTGTGAVNVTLSDSTVSGSVNGGGASGVLASSAAAHSVLNLVLKRTTITGNDQGAVAGTNANVWLAQSSITGNTVGYKSASGGAITSYGDNTIDDNGSNTGSLGGAARQ